MKRSTVVLLLCLGFSSLVQASEEAAWARAALEIPCHALVTEAECRSHQGSLASLLPGAERDAYLTQYAAMLEERVRSCGCSVAQNGVGVLRYR